MYRLGYDLSKYTSLVWESTRLIQTGSESALNKKGMSKEVLDKHRKLYFSKSMLLQPSFNALNLDININKTLDQIANQHFIVFEEGFDIMQDMLKVYMQIYRNIEFHYDKKTADIFYIAVFCGDESRRGSGFFKEEVVQPYNQLAPKINKKLKNLGFQFTLKSKVDKPIAMINELKYLDKEMRLLLHCPSH